MNNAANPSLEILDSQIAMIRLGQPNEKVVILTEERLLALEEILINLASKSYLGLIITGSSESMFSAGADIKIIQATTEETEGKALAQKGQSIFQLIEDLNMITVAAISGPCVGGACELALACDFRIISDHAKSSIGLPEVKIGILPGFGGTQRLPRLIGISKALGLILKGKVLKAKQALNIGLVDKVVEKDQLVSEAEKIILDAKPKEDYVSLKDKIAAKIGLFRKIAAKQAKDAIYKQSKNFYPAPYAAIDSIIYGLTHGLERGYDFEAKKLGELIVSAECKALTNLFFLTETAKGIGKPAKDHIVGLDSLVIGAGTMGAGIAGILARQRYPVYLKDTKNEAVQRGIQQIKKTLSYSRSLNEKDKTEVLDCVQGITDLPEDLNELDFVIEAIFESMELKKQVLGEIAEKVKSDCIIASNTSSLSISEIASEINNPERVVGMHFFNPVPRMPLVEIIRGEKTSNEVICIVAALASKLGKNPIVVEDVPGFLVNRILIPYLNEAVYLLEDGYQIEDIDKAALDFGLPMGPVRLLDEIGLDVAMHVSNTMVDGYGKRMQAPQFSHKLVEAERFGKKSHAGFYNFVSSPEVPDPKAYEILEITTRKQAEPELIQKRLIMSLVNEAVLCLDEGVAGQPGRDAARQIDLGSVMGFGFPAFRGGLIYYANSIGPTKLVNEMQTLERQIHERFRPHSGIFARAEKRASFYE